MARQIVDASGVVWRVALSGRRTSYGRDELSLEFERREAPREVRYCRFSPQGAKMGERALEEARDADLLRYLATAQPAWTSPDGEYGQSHAG